VKDELFIEMTPCLSASSSQHVEGTEYTLGSARQDSSSTGPQSSLE